jgi:hypothetical protein
LYIASFLEQSLLKDKCSIAVYKYAKLMLFYVMEIYVSHIVEFCSIVRNSPSHGQWENAWPLSGIRVDLVRDEIDLVRDQVVLVRD